MRMTGPPVVQLPSAARDIRNVPDDRMGILQRFRRQEQVTIRSGREL